MLIAHSFRLRNDLYCVGWALNSTHSLTPIAHSSQFMGRSCEDQISTHVGIIIYFQQDIHQDTKFRLRMGGTKNLCHGKYRQEVLRYQVVPNTGNGKTSK